MSKISLTTNLLAKRKFCATIDFNNMGWFGEICRHEQSFRRFAGNRRQATRVISELERWHLGIGEFSLKLHQATMVPQERRDCHAQIPKSRFKQRIEDQNRRCLGHLFSALVGFDGMTPQWLKYAENHWDELADLSVSCAGARAHIGGLKEQEPVKLEPRGIIFQAA